MLICIHEENAVAIAHGYAKVTGSPLLVLVHANVGLLHAAMSIYNAFVDRVPMIILGGNGPVDAAKRRPWIDWIHTSIDPGSSVRDFTKWDDQPISLDGSIEAVLRAWVISRTPPFGPVYVALDSAMQEQPVTAHIDLPEIERYDVPQSNDARTIDVERAAEMLLAARNPLILAGRVSRRLDAWNDRIRLAELLESRVVTTLRVGAAFPTGHPLHVGPTGQFLLEPSLEAIREADVILNLDFVDVAGAFKQAFGAHRTAARIISVSMDRYVHKAWSRDYFSLGPVDIDFTIDPDAFVTQLLKVLEARRPRHRDNLRQTASVADILPAGDERPIELPDLSTAVRHHAGSQPVCFIRSPIGAANFEFTHPLDYLGYDGAGGVGSGPGMAVGAALALRDHEPERLPVAVIGDGDFLMSASALWTAVKERIPVLFIIANNRSFFNDELHQDRMARDRHRPVENRWIGQRLDDPAPDLAALARSFGALAYGPLETNQQLYAAVGEAVAAVRAGKVCVIDALVMVGASGAGGYSASVAAAITGAR